MLSLSALVADLELSPDQKKAEEALLAFWKARGRLLTMGGYAGTGKTTTVAHAIRSFGAATGDKDRPSIGFCAFTGKAASVLRGKLITADALGPTDYCGTIHALIYSPIINARGLVCGFTLKPKCDVLVDMFVVDEASMLDENLFRDLQSYGLPILAVGDHGQLPPVMGKFNLMQNPEIRLEKIHRQAEDNPIIRVSRMAREEGRIPVGEFGPGVRKVAGHHVLFEMKDLHQSLVLCGRNRTRVFWNKKIRFQAGRSAKDLAGATPAPISGDRVICLKNNRQAGIWNGMTGNVNSCEPVGKHWYLLNVTLDGQDYRYFGRVFKHQFNVEQTIRDFEGCEPKDMGDLWDFGYCLTVHKAQGSESDDVVVIEERMGMQTDDDWRRWLYTAVTRAKQNLLIVGS